MISLSKVWPALCQISMTVVLTVLINLIKDVGMEVTKLSVLTVLVSVVFTSVPSLHPLTFGQSSLVLDQSTTRMWHNRHPGTESTCVLTCPWSFSVYTDYHLINLGKHFLM